MNNLYRNIAFTVFLCGFVINGLHAQFQYIQADLWENGNPLPNYPVWVLVDTPSPTYIIGTTDSSGVFMDSIPILTGSARIEIFTFDCNQNYVKRTSTLDSSQILFADTLMLTCASTQPPTCNAAFTWVLDTPSTVSFTNNSTQSFWFSSAYTEYLWDFGDGSTSSDVNPVHLYANPGFYPVSLTISVRDSLDTNFILKNDVELQTIVAGSPDCDASYTFTVVNDSSVSFSNTSTSNGIPFFTVNLYQWDFGDGTSSNLSNPPAHIYKADGQYTICLEQYVIDTSVTPVDTVCSSTFCNTVNITIPLPTVCTAGFTVDPDSSSNQVSFTSTSTVSQPGLNVTLNWDFGDGDTATGIVVNHVFVPDTSAYNVCLTLTVRDTSGNIVCTDTLCQAVTVAVPPGNFCQASFIIDTVNSFNGSVYVWNNSSPQPNNFNYQNTYSWDFGDNTVSSQAFPTHVYGSPGTYVLALELISVDLSTGSQCQSVYTDTLSVDSLGNIVNKAGTGFKLIVLNPANLGQEELKASVKAIYPNPAYNELMIELAETNDEEMWEFKMTDIKGSLVWNEERKVHADTRVRVDVSAWPEGLYILMIKSGNRVSHHKIKIDR